MLVIGLWLAAVYWAAESRIESAQGMNRQTGELVELEGRTLTWQSPDGKHAAEETVELSGRFTELDRLGLWTTDAAERGSAALLSADDTRLPTHREPQGDAAGSPTVGSRFQGDLVPLLLWGVFGLFLVESWLFHRYVAY